MRTQKENQTVTRVTSVDCRTRDGVESLVRELDTADRQSLPSRVKSLSPVEVYDSAVKLVMQLAVFQLGAGGSVTLESALAPQDLCELHNWREALPLMRRGNATAQTPELNALLNTLRARVIDIEDLGSLYESLADYTAVRAAEPMLDLAATGGRCVRVSLAELDRKGREGMEPFLAWLRSQTGRSIGALRRDLEPPCGEQALDASARAMRYAGLARRDACGRPMVIEAGKLYLVSAPNRRSKGQHYTPRRLAEAVVAQALEPLVYSVAGGTASGARVLRTPSEILEFRVCDIACGTGALLLEAGRYLAARLVEAFAQHGADPVPSAGEVRTLVVRHCLRGVDQDPIAADVARWSLRLWASADDPAAETGEPSIRCGDALVGRERPGTRESWPEHESPTSKVFHWPEEFPEAFANRQGFDAIIGNPPWGQKRMADDAARKRYIRQHYPSSVGIYDLFRPFVERAVRLLRPGGSLGLVLPDIVLLKDYPQTRKYLLDQLRILSIEWYGQAFRDAMIDTVTLVGIKETSDAEHAIDAAIHEPHGTQRRRIRQSLFLREPRYTFNLGMSEQRRATLDRLASLPCLGDCFEIHEGVHSGNIRRELFCDAKRDESCREMYLGGDEICPYLLRWGGRYIRLDALPEAKAAGRYAHLGRREWFEQPKVLVRRTGDYVLAAADFSGRYASNNFFVVLPSRCCLLGLPGLAAMLNSRFTTSFFRAIEPRVGRAFAELKIKHLRRFPLPAAVLGGSAEAIEACQQLDALGRERARLASATEPAVPDDHQRLDAQINALVESLLATTPDDFDD